jgi:glutamate synthase (NADPH/NADH) small chain
MSVKLNTALGREMSLTELRSQFDAVVLGIGLGGMKTLGIPGEDLPGVQDAVRMIEKLRQTSDLSTLQLGQNAVIIGGGSTAIDLAIELRQLGVDSVTLVYRGAEEKMSATAHERGLARQQGVMIRTFSKPSRMLADRGWVIGVEFERTRPAQSGRYILTADRVFKAIGQSLEGSIWCLEQEIPNIENGKIQVSDSFETSLPGVFAVGDCIAAGSDLTVVAVQQGKLVAQIIESRFSQKSERGVLHHGGSFLSGRGSEISQSFLAGLGPTHG